MGALETSVRNALRQQRLQVENRELLERLQSSNERLTLSNAQLQAAAEHLQQSENKYRTVVERAADGIFIVAPESGRFIELNPSMEILTGYPREELLAMILPLLLPEGEQLAAIELLNRTVERGRGAAEYLSFRKKNGKRISIDLNTTLVEYQAGKAVLGIARDITERKAVEERLRETSRLISVGELAAGVAHEINNPLTIILGFSQLLSSRDLPEPMGDQIQRIYSEAQRTAKIVQNLLSFARRREPEKRYLAVTEILERALELKSHDFKMNNIEVANRWAPNLPRIMADEHQMIQVILNILTNAEHAMTESRSGGKLEIGADRVDNKLRISFTDDGPGISGEQLRRIFDPFFTTKEVGKGTGLGLSICYGIVRQHGGEIWAESSPDKGATFYIELPIVAPGGEVRAEDIVLKHGPGVTKHLLVVDDEPNMRNFLSDALASEHYTVDSAQDGEEAWRKLQTRPYDCILLDLKMPKMSGQQLYRLIAEHDEEQAKKVIFITGDVIGAETSAFISATGNPALLKPFNLDELRKQILHVQSTTRAVDAQATTGEGDF